MSTPFAEGLARSMMSQLARLMIFLEEYETDPDKRWRMLRDEASRYARRPRPPKPKGGPPPSYSGRAS
jgi:hypothetical protein